MVDDIRERRSVADDSPEPEPSFVPPESVAQEEEIIDMAWTDPLPEKPPKQSKSNNNAKKNGKKPSRLGVWFEGRKAWWHERSKKQRIILSAVAAGVIIGLGLGGFLLLHHSPAPKPAVPVANQEVPAEPPKPTSEASKLTGIQVQPEFNQLPITGIMIENSPDARPQSGLNEAGVVFEAVAEGGITRFLTLWQEAQPDYVGPVRSARPYYLEWLQGFDAAIAHVGGSPDALSKIQSDGIKDLDQFYNGGAYQRVSSRYAPHNVYTSLGSLLALQKNKGFSSDFVGFPRKVETVGATPTAKSINFDISGPLYKVHYDYDASANAYKRSEGGKPHTDERSGKQITPKVVIAIVLEQGVASDGLHTTYKVLGSGEAFIFQDGQVTKGTWSKESDKQQIRFGDANGSPIGLNAGQTWITVVGSASNVSYTP